MPPLPFLRATHRGPPAAPVVPEHLRRFGRTCSASVFEPRQLWLSARAWAEAPARALCFYCRSFGRHAVAHPLRRGYRSTSAASGAYTRCRSSNLGSSGTLASVAAEAASRGSRTWLPFRQATRRASAAPPQRRDAAVSPASHFAPVSGPRSLLASSFPSAEADGSGDAAGRPFLRATCRGSPGCRGCRSTSVVPDAAWTPAGLLWQVSRRSGPRRGGGSCRTLAPAAPSGGAAWSPRRRGCRSTSSVPGSHPASVLGPHRRPPPACCRCRSSRSGLRASGVAPSGGAPRAPSTSSAPKHLLGLGARGAPVSRPRQRLPASHRGRRSDRGGLLASAAGPGAARGFVLAAPVVPKHRHRCGARPAHQSSNLGGLSMPAPLPPRRLRGRRRPAAEPLGDAP